MEFEIDGKAYEIRFTHRVIVAILKKMGINTLNDLAQVADKYQMTKVHEYIYLALYTSETTRDGKRPKDLPTQADIEWAMDENNLSSGFYQAFLKGVQQMHGVSDNVEQELVSGN